MGVADFFATTSSSAKVLEAADPLAPVWNQRTRPPIALYGRVPTRARDHSATYDTRPQGELGPRVRHTRPDAEPGDRLDSVGARRQTGFASPNRFLSSVSSLSFE